MLDVILPSDSLFVDIPSNSAFIVSIGKKENFDFLTIASGYSLFGSISSLFAIVEEKYKLGAISVIDEVDMESTKKTLIALLIVDVFLDSNCFILDKIIPSNSLFNLLT